MDGPSRPRRDSQTPEFARETRIVGMGQDNALPIALSRLATADPLPEILDVGFRVEAGAGAGTTISMVKPIVILGRVQGIADVVIEDEAASRYHACISHRHGEFLLTDMGSTNGTFLNGAAVTESKLVHGDRIQIGQTVLVFEIRAAK